MAQFIANMGAKIQTLLTLTKKKWHILLFCAQNLHFNLLY